VQGNLKILFAGPTGAGKTTAVSAVCDGPVVSTNESATDMTRDLKPKTTVALDFGIAALGGLEPIHVYGAPGQERFSFMWDILTQGGSGLILLADASRPRPIDDMIFYLKTFEDYICESSKLAIGITRSDVTTGPGIAEYRSALHQLDLDPPIMKIDARNKQDVTKLMMALMASMSPILVRKQAEPAF